MKKLFTATICLLLLFGCELPEKLPKKGLEISSNIQSENIKTEENTKLVFVSPSNNSTDVLGKTPVTFMWDKPIFVLQNAEKSQKWLKKNISITPSMKGSWQILGTMGILFEPKEEWKYSTRYEFNISKELGGEIIEYAFDTPLVKLKKIEAKELIFRKPFLVYLNQSIPLDEAKKFWVKPEIEFVVQYHENEKTRKKDKTIIELIPKSDWIENTHYTLGIPKSIQGLEGNLSTSVEQTKDFKTISPFTVKFGKGSGTDVFQDLNLRFSSQVSYNDFLDFIQLVPIESSEWESYIEKEKEETVSRFGEDYKSYYFRIPSPWAHWIPQKEQTLTIKKGLKDKYGRVLKEDKIYSFTPKFPNTVRSIFFPNEIKTYQFGTIPKYYIWYSGEHRNVSFKIERIPPKNFTFEKNVFHKNFTWESRLERRQVVEFDFAKEFPELVDENKLLAPGIYKVQLFYTPNGNSYARTITSEFAVLDFPVELKQTANNEMIVYPEIIEEIVDIDIFVKHWKSSCNCQVIEHESSHKNVTVPFKFSIDRNKRYVFVRNGDQIGIGSTEFEKGIRPYDAPISFNPYKYGEILTSEVFSDRPLYRPGDKVFFKSIFRERLFFEKEFPLKDIDLDKEYSYRVKVLDAQYKEVYSEKFKTNGGSLNGEWIIPKNGGLGQYQLIIEFLDSKEKQIFQKQVNFYVTEYRKPTFLIDAEFDDLRAIWKDDISAEVSAEYAFGGKMAGKKVSYQVSLFGQEQQQWYWHRGTNKDKILTKGETILDKNGKLFIPIKLDFILDEKIDWNLVNLSVTVEASPSEKSSKTISIPFYNSSEKIQLDNGRYFYKAEHENIDVLGKITDLDDNFLEDKDITIQLFQTKWVRNDRRSGNGDFVGEWQSTEVLIHEEEIESNEQGKFLAQVKVPEESGQYFVRVISEDRKDRLAKVERHFWVWTDKHEQFSMRQNEVNRILPLFSDKDDYQVGEDIEVLFPHNKWKIDKSHITIERGTVLETLEANLKNNTVSFKAESWMAPNIFVSILIEGKDERGIPQIRWGVINVPISDPNHELSIKLTPDKKEYHPKEIVSLDIFTESNGKPVSSEVTIAVVDQTLLALKSRPKLELWKKFLAELPLGVRTFHSLANFLSEVELSDIYEKVEKIKAATESPFGGGGNEEKGGEFKSRGDFRDTAAFLATIQTDENGHAEAQIPLPDNLTKWHIWAVGSTAKNAFGEAETEIQTSLPILISPIVPNFFRAGDKTNIGLLVRRNITIPKEEEIKITMHLPSEIECKILERNVDIKEESRVFFPVYVPYEKHSIPIEGLDIEFRFDIEGTQSGLKDSVVLKRKIFPPVISTSVAEFLEVKESTNLTLRTDDRSLRSILEVKVFGTLLDRLQKFVDIAREMNLFCTEQKFSYWTSRMLQYELFSSIGKEIELIDIVKLEEARNDILKAQGHSGGFKFWSNSWYESEWLTAHILEFAPLWNEFGVNLPQENLEKAAHWLRKKVLSPCTPYWCISESTRQHAAFILIKEGILSSQDLDFLVSYLDSTEAKAWWIRSVDLTEIKAGTLNTKSIISPKVQTKKKEVTEELQRLMKFRDRYAFWEEINRSFYSQNERLTSILFEWVVENEMLESAQSKIARYLADTKSRLSGNSALRVLMALKNYSEVIPEDNWPTHFTMTNLEKDESKGIQGTLKSGIDKFEVKEFLPRSTEKTINFSSSNKKQFYADIQLHEVFQAVDLSPVQKGFWIEREIFEVNDKNFETPVTNLEIGEAYLVRIKVVTNTSHRQVVVEDTVPSGAEGINFDLENVDQNLQQFTKTEEDNNCYGWCRPRIEHKEFYFDKTRFFVPEMRAGAHEFKYLIQTRLEGEYELLPPKVFEMYYPEVYATGKGKRIEIQQ